MSKFVNSSKVALLSIIAIVFALFSNIFPAMADNTQSIFDNITASSSSTKAGSSETITVHFSEKYSGQIQPGSTYTLNIPQATDDEAGLKGPSNPTTIPLIDSNNGEQIGTVDIDGTKAVLKFNNNVANLQNIKGEFGFKVVVTAAKGANKDKTTKVNVDWGVPVKNVPHITVQPNNSSGGTIGITPQPAPVPVIPNVGVTKEGTEGQRGNINWQIHGSLSAGTNPKDVTITDNLPGTPEQKINYNAWWLSFTCNTGNGEGARIEQIPLSLVLNLGWGTISEGTNGFVFHLNPNAIAESYGFATALPMKFTINYQTKPVNPVAGQEYNNTATLNPNNGSSSQSQKASIKITNVWGNANGYNKGTLTLSKVDASDVSVLLGGAKFTLTNTTNGKTEALTSDSEGVIKATGLVAGSYTLKETTAPKGYKLNPTTYHFVITNEGKLTDSNLPSGYDIPDTKIVSSSSSSSSIKSSSSSKKSSSSVIVPSSSSEKKSSSSIESSSSNEIGIVGKQSSSSNNGQNSKKNNKLPQTGNVHNNVITLLGLLVMIIPVTVLIIVKRRKNN